MRFISSPAIKSWLFFLEGCFLSLLFNACSYSAKTTKKLFDQASTMQFDMVVVPGAPLENGAWGKAMKGRIYWTKYLYDRGIAKNIMFSGSAVYSPYYEGEVMSMYAIALGVPKEHVYAETQAEHSTENIYYSYQKATRLGFSRIALASDPFQTRLLQRFARKKVSPGIVMLPMVLDTMKMMEPTMTDPVIDIQRAYKKDFVSIRKRQGLFKRLKGTLGYNIRK